MGRKVEIMLRAGAGNQHGQNRPFEGQRGKAVLGTGKGKEGTKHKSDSLLLLEFVASY